MLQAQFGFGPTITGPLLRKAGLTLLAIKGHHDMEDTIAARLAIATTTISTLAIATTIAVI